MAWFDGFSSLKGQLSNLAKGVLVDDTEEVFIEEPGERQQQVETSSGNSKQDEPGPSGVSHSFTWNDAFSATDSFVGQDVPAPTRNEVSSPSHSSQPGTSELKQEEEGSVLSKGLASLLSIGKVQDVDEVIKVLKAENKALRDENESQARDIQRYTNVIAHLQSTVDVCQDENSNLSTGMEELDLQHQQEIEHVLTVKEDVQKQYEQLQNNYAELEQRYAELKEEHATPKPATTSVAVDPMESEEEDSGREDLMREIDERDKDIEILEHEIARLNEVVETLNGELATARESLPSIPENSEEMELKISALESDALVMREVRTNLETEVASGREHVTDLTKRINELNAMLKNQENVVIDCRKLTEKNAQQEQEIAHNRTYIEKLQNDSERSRNELSAEIGALQKELEEKKAYIERLEEGSEASNQFLQEENAKLNKKIGALVQQTHALDEQLERAQLENETKDKKLCELIFDSSSLKEEYKAYKEKSELELKQLENQLADLKNTQRANETSEALFKELTANLEVMQEKVRSLEVELQSAKGNEELLRVEILSLSESKQNLEKKLTENQSLENLMSQKDEIIRELQDKCESTRISREDERNAWDKEVDSLRNSISELQINKDLTRETVLELKKQLEEKEDELFKQNESYLCNMSHLEAELGEKTKENATLSNKVAELGASLKEVTKTSETSKGLTTQLQTLQQENSDLSRDNKTLRNEIELYKMTENQLDVLGARNKEYMAKLEEEGEKNKSLQNENDELRRSLELKHSESMSYKSEIQCLNDALHAGAGKLEKLSQDNAQLTNTHTELENQTREKLALFENMETEKNKEISTLNKEIESLKNQLEYASHLLKSVERGEGEGQGETPPHQKSCPNGCVETQEELKRLTAAVAKDQTENKQLRNKIEELTEKLNKDGAQLAMFREHLVKVEEGYSNELLIAQGKINELTAQLVDADDRVRTSSTVYTSANIRANQQVESLTQQVKLLTEHKEKLEIELSRAEDNYQKQCAAITNLQAVLHQFQREKESDIQFETERIRQKLTVSNAKNDELLREIEQLQNQLLEKTKGLAAANRLTEQLDLKLQLIESLNHQVNDLTTKLKAEEEKLKAAYMNVEGKVDRSLLKNLLVGYVCSPPNSKAQVLKVIAQVLDLTREERVKVGLEPGSNVQHQSLSEAFIRFLESESQPKPIVPLSRPNSNPPSRKTSQAGPGSLLLLSEELPSMPHFTVGRNSAGSILKDVLKDRTT